MWTGSLLEGQRDASGQMYMRNRYYDPATGQFTQTDPIGLAGGTNPYGFGAGDPVSNRDPYGLKCQTISEGTDAERLSCTGVTEADFNDVADYLGGETGRAAYRMLTGNSVVQTSQKVIVLTFVANDNDKAKFRVCPDEIRHRETEGSFEGLWIMDAVQSGHWMRLVGPLKRPDVQPVERYRGEVRTAQYGTRKAYGFVWCETGDAEFTSVPFLWP